MIGKIDNLTLFTSDGENLGTINAKSIENEENKGNKLRNNIEKYEFKCELKLDLFTYYSLMFGYKMTNNYLKMHGGIMRRRK